MRSQSAIFIVLLAAVSPAAAAPVALSETSLTGTWECGPTAMKAPSAVITVVSVIKRAADLTFTSLATTVITSSDRPTLTFVASDAGAWRLDGNTLVSDYHASTFISASDPRISTAAGQQVLDAEQRKKSTFKSTILEIGPSAMRSIPLDPTYPEAMVEVTCRRIDA
ncbi:hypothetical protein [Massilia rubra]|uniref:Uncharacterized protein n=1 Tax=Massilia rubra TaxID=2607910 RepID=A0ABX0LLA8_9BURK|nr:hypothetical protein [Massilia rubra]NHZ35060.1 hypothetical protein [Massilia rubra]